MKAIAITREMRKLEDASRISAIIIMKDGEHVGTARIKYPADGAGRLSAYLADWTLEMPESVNWDKFTRWQIGRANGYGYDKATAAFGSMKLCGFELKDAGWGWDHQLREAGFTLIQAI